MADYTEIYIKRDSTLNWYAANPRLGLGEPGIDMTLHRFKVGNGIDRWNELPYMDDDLYKLLDKNEQVAADKAQELLNLINANKLEADTKHNSLTMEVRNTSRDLNERMTFVETEQVEYEELLSGRQAEYEEALTGDFEETKAEVHAGLDEFNETRDKLTVRMDAIAGQATEDTEILDARVDAEYQTHENLGANIRNIHTVLLGAIETESQDKAELDAEIAVLRESDRAETAERVSGYEEHGAELRRLSNQSGKHSEYEDFLQEQTNDNAEGLLRTQMLVYEEVRRGHEESSRLDEEITARESGDAEIERAVESEASERERADTELNNYIGQIETELIESLEQETRVRELSDEELSARLDDTSNRITQAEEDIELNAEAMTAELEENLKAAERLSQRPFEREDYLQEQINENASANLQQSLELYEECEKRRKLEDVISGMTSPVDWSKTESLAIPEPRCAVVNFTGLASMPTSKTADISAVLEFWDMQGNYFRKPIVCSAQGSSSMGFVKKNVKVDLLNEDGSEFELKIGNWVEQDGFHLKAYYTDFFRGVGAVCYKVWEEIMETKPYRRALVDTAGMNATATGSGNVSDLTLQIDTGALCHPDGFPCIVYLNGDFYGVFSWQIKKQRKNYHMDKSPVEQIHLDGALMRDAFWSNAINWAAFEIRNPNKLYTMDGKKYDGDAPRELIDETSGKYDPDNKDHVRSAKVKKSIQSLTQRFMDFRALYTQHTSSRTEEKLTELKAAYEELFDWENQRDYLIFMDIIKDGDGFGKNWQWTTYDGVKWYVNAYDLDGVFGAYHLGDRLSAPHTGHMAAALNCPTYYAALLYQSELEARYRKLRDAGIIDADHITAKLADWTARIGEQNYELEYERWPNSPCLVSFNDSVDRVRKWLTVEIANMDKLYNYNPDAAAEELKADIEGLRSSDETAAKIRYDDDKGLKTQIDELSYLVFAMILAHDTDRKNLDARLKVIEEALVDGGLLDESDIPPATDTDIYSMIADVFSGNDTEEPAPVDEDEAEFYEDLDKIFNP